MFNGPSVTITYSCGRCKHHTSERFQCQSDSGYDITCNHPYIGQKHVASYGTRTPDWCPLLLIVKKETARKLLKGD